MSCATKKESATSEVKSSFEEIVYDAHTRGRINAITVTKASLVHKTQNDSQTVKLSPEELSKLNKEVALIDLDKISSLKSPTNQRLFDGAMHTTITIKFEGKEYVSSQFDHDNPPSELMSLSNYLLKLAESK